MREIKYKVIETGSTTALMQQVNKFIAEGWLPIGGVSIKHDYMEKLGLAGLGNRVTQNYLQAMLKETTK